MDYQISYISTYDDQIHYFRYLTKETMIRERLIRTSNTVDNMAVPFIGLTICPDYLVAYKDATLKNYGLDKYRYRMRGVYVNQTSNRSDDLHVIYDSITYDLDEILFSITIFTNNGTRDGVIIELNKMQYYDDIEVTTKYWNTLGKCYSIYPKNHLLEQSILRIDMVSHIDTYIIFGYPGQFMHPNTKTKVIVTVKTIVSH